MEENWDSLGEDIVVNVGDRISALMKVVNLFPKAGSDVSIDIEMEIDVFSLGPDFVGDVGDSNVGGSITVAYKHGL